MTRWIPPVEEDAAMLSELGITSVEELFRDIPKKARMKKIGLGGSLDEEDVTLEIERLLGRNRTMSDFDSFLGGGLYSRYPSVMADGLIQRSEFYTAYTPYQAEASQGTLQCLFEFQSLWVELTNMEVANASLYDGATAIGEALLMARRIHEGNRFLIPASTFWEKKSVISNYVKGLGAEIVEVPWDPSTGALDADMIEKEAKNDCFGVLAEYPDSFGILQESLPSLKSRIGDVPLVVAADPLALTLLEPPGSWGADIVVGEGQGFGVPISYGGPLLGLMACRRSAMRQMPGRIVGATKDHDGRRAFCLTLQTREQHIRRSKATSNVCTNNSLVALAFLAYASTVGPSGLKKLATRFTQKAHGLAEALGGVKGLSAPLFSAPYMFDFVVGVENGKTEEFLSAMAKRGILAGTSLGNPCPGAKALPFNGYLTSVGWRVDDDSIARYAKEAAATLGGGQ
jgi:glycine dehydrogenase subunit 1